MTSVAAGDAPRRDFMAGVASTLPRLLYGLRFSAAINLALFVTFWLELETPSWAGTSAGIVAQPSLGQSIRKGFFRLIGTAIGAVTSVLLTAAFPQDRLGLLLGMALWTAACSFVSTVLRNFAAYAAMLAGYTTVIIASDSISAPGSVFTLAVSRASEIAIGIVCAAIVMAGTDFGATRRQLAERIAGLVEDITDHVRGALATDGHIRNDVDARRAMVARVAGLDPLIDQGTGESAELRHRRSTLYGAMRGLFDALIAWRIIVLHLMTLGPGEARAHAHRVLEAIPPLPAGASREDWILRRDRANRLVGTLAGLKADDPSVRLLADASARTALGLGRAANGIVLLTDPAQARIIRARLRLHVPDVLPPLVNALRTFLTVAVAALFWIATAWPSGPSAILFATVTVMLLSPQQEQGVKAAVGFGLGTCIAATVAGFVKFALLPNHDSFASLALIIAAAGVPLAALSTVPACRGIFTGAAMNFVPLLGPTNQITYDTTSFYNSALAIVGGCVFGALMMRVLPPIAPEIRARRLSRLTLRDLRALALRRRAMPTLDAWRRRILLRLLAVPEGTDLEHGAAIMAALSIGRQIIRLRRYAGVHGLDGEVSATLASLAEGDLESFERRLDHLDARLVEDGRAHRGRLARQRARTAILVIREALAGHEAYFGGLT